MAGAHLVGLTRKIGGAIAFRTLVFQPTAVNTLCVKKRERQFCRAPQSAEQRKCMAGNSVLVKEAAERDSWRISQVLVVLLYNCYYWLARHVTTGGGCDKKRASLAFI